jgi:hypothetical protein
MIYNDQFLSRSGMTPSAVDNTVMKYQPPSIKMTNLQFRLLKKSVRLWSFWKNKNA